MNLKKITTFLLINFLILFFLIIFTETFLGTWFEKNSFSHHMRGKRLQKIEFNFEKTNFSNFSANTTFRRDYYGFREEHEFDDKYDLSKIKLVFNGGSTGEEMFIPYDKTIVGNLNNFFKEDNFKFKIYNASLSGKSLLGKINDFDVWFNKLENFSPQYMIFYVGINDRKIPKKRFHDNNEEMNFSQKMINNISQKSFFWKKIKELKDIYFTTVREGHRFFDSDVQKKIKNGYVSFSEANEKFKIESLEEKNTVENYSKNLNRLKNILKIKKIEPIFITQINYEGNGDKMLFLLNKELKKFSYQNGFNIINLDEKINEPVNHLFWDEIHTNELGSLYISEIIYPELKKIIIKNN